MATPSIFRIVCMDGGDGRVTAHLLDGIRQQLGSDQDNFLNHADAFVGTSAGGINALLLAAREKGQRDAFVPDLFNLWTELLGAMLPLPPAHLPPAVVSHLGPLGPLIYPMQMAQYLLQLGLSVIGLHSFVNNNALRAKLEAQLGNRTLKDLNARVAVVSLQLDNEAPNPVNRHWAARVFSNVMRPTDTYNPDLQELCIDVALRTSAQPIYFPIFQSITGRGPGFIDGGYVANNPSMVAIGQAFHLLASSSPKSAPAPATVTQAAPSAQPAPKVLMLSLGAGSRNMLPGPAYLGPHQVPFVGGSSYWGYLSWLLNPFAPFLLLNVFLQGQSEEAAFQAQSVLTENNYRRLDPRVNDSRQLSAPQLKDSINDLISDAEYDRIALWLKTSGWVNEPAS